MNAFHAGEMAMQHHAGVRERLEEIGGRAIRDHMPEQHRGFFRTLPTLVVGSVDGQGRPWASMLAGRPGFIDSPDARHLRVEAWPAGADVLARHLAVGAPLGLLGIQPHTRRRNRMNGRVVETHAGGFEVRVDQSFGNCPQYIQAREPRESDEAPLAARSFATKLDASSRSLIGRADTLFIASATPAASRAAPCGGERSDGVDVSHRGGRPGFVRVDDEDGGTVLTFPDFRGNFFFNTLGNIVSHPYAGLLFVDHETGDLLQISGRAEVIGEGPALRAFEGAQYLVRVRVDTGVWRPRGLPLRWSAPAFASQLADTGDWPR